MDKMTVRDVSFQGKRVVMRVDFNVPIQDGVVQDNTRIRAALPTIKYVLEQGAKSLVLMSHLGDPKKDMQKAKEKADKAGKVFDEKSYIEGKHKMAPVAAECAKLLGKKVSLAPACMGIETEAMVKALGVGEVLMLENTRFHPEETSKQEADREKMGKALSQYGDIFVNDAFGSAHRAHASTEAVAHYIPAVAGFLLEKEIEYLQEKVVNNPARPCVAIIGGAKVSSKLAVLEHLMGKVDRMIIAGGMSYTFLKAKGLDIGMSLVEDDMLDTARKILSKAHDQKVHLYLPVDHIVTKEFAPDATFRHVVRGGIGEDVMGMDIGPLSIQMFIHILRGAKTVIWNGPVGVFEFEKFANGTVSLAKAIAELPGCTSVIGGGDSVSAVNKAGVADKMSHISTGGGASLELLEGKVLPGVAALNDKKKSGGCGCSCSCC